MREDVGEHEPRQKVIDLVEPDEHAKRGGGEDVEKREHDVRADGARQRRRRRRRATWTPTRMMPVPTVMADHAMPAVLLQPEVRHHADDADEDRANAV